MDSLNITRTWRDLGAATIVLVACGMATTAVAQETPDPPLGLTPRGELRLQLGETATAGHVPRRWVLNDTAGGTWSQSITDYSKCLYRAGTGQLLANLTATGGNGTVGVGPDSIGVWDGPRGVACYRISSNVGTGETLKFGLGGDVLGLVDANAFYRLELDMELKNNAYFRLDILIGGTVTDSYYLRSGASIIGETPEKTQDCEGLSDSGPDSGPNDNCRWIVDALGQEFRLVPLSGEGSLEGGGDFGGAAYVNNSVVYLTSGNIGALGCESEAVPQGTGTGTIGDGVNDAACTVTRIDPTGFGGSCTTAVGYVFRNLGGTGLEGCELVKTPGEQLVASIDIDFPPEPSVPLGSEPATQIYFDNPGVAGPALLGPFTPGRCDGTVVFDANGNPTIAEVLATPADAAFYDWIDQGTDYPDDPVEYACILENGQVYVGPAGAPQMQIGQKILFWGDVRFQRD